MVPVFIVNGFLESGKSTFIQSAICEDPKMKKERVVIIACEEGEIDYEDIPDNFHVCMIDEKEDMTEEFFKKADEKYTPTYVIIEYNGIWGMESLYNAKMPSAWSIMDQLTIIDATTFESYFSNMKSIFADMLRASATVIMNRCTRNDDFKFYKDNIKRAAPRADIMYVSDIEGIMDITLEEDLPYNLNDEVISLNKESYIIWYIDMMDNIGRYVGKNVEFVGQVAKPKFFREECFHAGNMVMTCCEDDMQFLGFVCKYNNAKTLKEGSFIKLTGEIKFEFAPEYEAEGPVIYVKSVTPAKKSI